MRVSPETAARALRLAARFERDEPGCEPFARASHDCDISLRCVEPYTDGATEAVKRLSLTLWHAKARMGAIRWNERLTNLARIAGEAL